MKSTYYAPFLWEKRHFWQKPKPFFARNFGPFSKNENFSENSALSVFNTWDPLTSWKILWDIFGEKLFTDLLTYWHNDLITWWRMQFHRTFLLEGGGPEILLLIRHWKTNPKGFNLNPQGKIWKKYLICTSQKTNGKDFYKILERPYMKIAKVI